MKISVGITGCSGSLGRSILKNNKEYKFNCFKGNIKNVTKVQNWIKSNNFEILIHLAAIVPIKDVNKNRKNALEVNYFGTKNIVNCLKNSSVRWFFFSSTSHVYQSSKKKILESDKKKPISYYGKTKLLAENFIIKKLKNTKIKYCIGRIFSTSNKNQKKNYLVPDLIKKIKRTKKKITLYNLNHYRDFITMNLISKIILLLSKKKYNGIINIGRGKKILLKDIAKLICKKYKKDFNFIDNKKPTFLIANNNKLKKITKVKFENKLENLIF